MLETVFATLGSWFEEIKSLPYPWNSEEFAHSTVEPWVALIIAFGAIIVCLIPMFIELWLTRPQYKAGDEEVHLDWLKDKEPNQWQSQPQVIFWPMLEDQDEHLY